MIGRLSGVLVEKSPPWVLLEVAGVGYEIQVPMSTFYNLPELKESASLLTQLIVREDAHLLFGFLTAAEREAFRQLVKISGVGPRTALALLSGLSAQELAQAVSTQEVARLLKVPGIGKKTAERLLLELKGKLAPDISPATTPTSHSPAHHDILQALIALGYSEREAVLTLKKLPADIEVSAGIKLALKTLTP